MGTATGVVHNFWVVRGETFHTPMGTATGFSHRASRRRNGNISYPYGDSNEIPRLNKRILKKYFIPLWGQQPAKIEIALSTLMKHFIPLWGQQHLRGRHGRHSGRNISYPDGDSNVEDAATAVIAVETFRSPMGTATGHAGPASKKRRETFHTPTGTATTRPNS